MLKILEKKEMCVMIDLVKKYHADQFRNNGKIPYWQHCLSVAEIVGNALENTQEIKEKDALFATIIHGALGHDLFEDTSVTKKEIIEKFGKHVEELIFSLTNEEDDKNRDAYMDKIKKSSEEAALIKYSDLIENTISAAYSIHDLGVAWAKDFYKPIKNDIKKILAIKKFILYPKTAALLREQFLFVEERFENNLLKYNHI